ncbi:MAG: ABC transporter permease [Thermomicrobiales bacterium]
MHTLIVMRTYLKLGMLNIVQYRANFLFELVGVATYLATAMLGLAVVFNQTSNLNGWGPDELIALVGIQIMIGGLIGFIIRPSMQQLMENVRLGTLDFMLTKPADSQVMASMQQISAGSIIEIVVGFVVMVIGMVRLGDAVGIGQGLLFLAMLLAGVVIVYCFLLMLSTLSFWFVKLDNVLVIFGTAFNEAGRWPIGIYPGWLRVSLTFLVPVAFAVTVPAESLSGRVDTSTVFAAIGLALGFAIFSRWFWRFGLKHYTGASA